MAQFSIDMADLAARLEKPQKISIEEPNKIPYQNNKNKFIKVAFDMFESKYDHTIWELAEEDNSKYLIKRTDLENHAIETTASDNSVVYVDGPWVAIAEKDQPISLYLLAAKVRTFNPKVFQYDNENANDFANHIVNTVKANKIIAKKYVLGMSVDQKQRFLHVCKENMAHEEVRLAYSWLIKQ